MLTSILALKRVLLEESAHKVDFEKAELLLKFDWRQAAEISEVNQPLSHSDARVRQNVLQLM